MLSLQCLVRRFTRLSARLRSRQQRCGGRRGVDGYRKRLLAASTIALSGKGGTNGRRQCRCDVGWVGLAADGLFVARSLRLLPLCCPTSLHRVRAREGFTYVAAEVSRVWMTQNLSVLALIRAKFNCFRAKRDKLLS